jgi:hypothetical protein
VEELGTVEVVVARHLWQRLSLRVQFNMVGVHKGKIREKCSIDQSK